MKKLFLLLATVLISGCAFTAGSNQPPTVTPAKIPAGSTPITFGTSTLTLVTETTSTEPIEVSISSLPYNLIMFNDVQAWKTPSTSVEVNYPIMAYPSRPNLAEAFNAAVMDRTEQLRSEFLKNVVANSLDNNTNPEMGSETQISVMVIYNSPSLVSLRYVVETYYSGAAHPNTTSFSLNFDIDQSRELKLNNIFVSSTPYLSKLSQLTIDALKKLTGVSGEPIQLDPDWVKQGAGSKPENYHTVNLMANDLAVTFDAYDVGSYADGWHEITIPYQKLKGTIDPMLIKKLN